MLHMKKYEVGGKLNQSAASNHKPLFLSQQVSPTGPKYDLALPKPSQDANSNSNSSKNNSICSRGGSQGALSQGHSSGPSTAIKQRRLSAFRYSSSQDTGSDEDGNRLSADNEAPHSTLPLTSDLGTLQSSFLKPKQETLEMVHSEKDEVDVFSTQEEFKVHSLQTISEQTFNDVSENGGDHNAAQIQFSNFQQVQRQPTLCREQQLTAEIDRKKKKAPVNFLFELEKHQRSVRVEQHSLGDNDQQEAFLFDSLNSFASSVKNKAAKVSPSIAKTGMEERLKEAIENFQQEKDQSQRKQFDYDHTQVLQSRVAELVRQSEGQQREIGECRLVISNKDAELQELRVRLKEYELQLEHQTELLNREREEKAKNWKQFMQTIARFKSINKENQQSIGSCVSSYVKQTGALGKQAKVTQSANAGSRVQALHSRKQSDQRDVNSTMQTSGFVFDSNVFAPVQASSTIDHDFSSQQTCTIDKLHQLKSDLVAKTLQDKDFKRQRRRKGNQSVWTHPAQPILQQLYSPIPTQPSRGTVKANLDAVNDTGRQHQNFFFSPPQSSPLHPQTNKSSHRQQPHFEHSKTENDECNYGVSNPSPLLDDEDDMEDFELKAGEEEEERNLELIFQGHSGGDYSPNSHTFFKHPFKNGAVADPEAQAVPRVHHNSAHSQQNIIIAPIQRGVSVRNYASIISAIKKPISELSPGVARPRVRCQTKQQSPINGIHFSEAPRSVHQHSVATANTTMSNTTNASTVSPLRDNVKSIPESLIKKQKFSASTYLAKPKCGARQLG